MSGRLASLPPRKSDTNTETTSTTTRNTIPADVSWRDAERGRLGTRVSWLATGSGEEAAGVIRYDVEAGRGTITIDDPERRNPLSNDAMADLALAVDRACSDESVRVVVITGAGDKAFSAGGDLSGGFMDTPIAGHGARGALAELFRSIDWS